MDIMVIVGNKEPSSKWKGLTNNGGSREDDGRGVRAIQTAYGIIPPASFGETKPHSRPSKPRSTKKTPEKVEETLAQAKRTLGDPNNPTVWILEPPVGPTDDTRFSRRQPRS